MGRRARVSHLSGKKKEQIEQIKIEKKKGFRWGTIHMALWGNGVRGRKKPKSEKAKKQSTTFL